MLSVVACCSFLLIQSCFLILHSLLKKLHAFLMHVLMSLLNELSVSRWHFCSFWALLTLSTACVRLLSHQGLALAHGWQILAVAAVATCNASIRVSADWLRGWGGSGSGDSRGWRVSWDLLMAFSSSFVHSSRLTSLRQYLMSSGLSISVCPWAIRNLIPR